MELFTRFRDTIFLKEDNDLEKQLVDLKKIRDNIKNTDDIDKDIKILEYGIQGESNIEFELRNANLGLYVLHDVTFEHEGNKCQIDYLIFSRGYFYIIECKNLFGNITVDASGQFTREYFYKNKKIKESIYSPYTQVMRHRDIMQKVWRREHNKFDNFLFGNKSDRWFIPIVVIANSKSILNTRYAPKDMKDNIIKVDQLINRIRNDIREMDRDYLANEKELKRAAETWLSRSIDNTSSITSKYHNNIVNNSLLEEELRIFRKERSKDMNIPAYYVFTDSELSLIIDKKPKTIKDLKDMNILPDIKVKCHGEDIIKIINK